MRRVRREGTPNIAEITSDVEPVLGVSTTTRSERLRLRAMSYPLGIVPRDGHVNDDRTFSMLS